MEMNSQNYWEDRFKSGSWAEFDGKNQTIGFAKMLIKNLPVWLTSELEKGGLTLFDAGCAEGGLVFELKKSFSSCNLIGMDFSESAIKTAQDLYANCSFLCGDITKLEENYDIIFSSNTLEHFKNPKDVLKGFFDHAKSHVVLMLPFEEYELSKEHFSFFDFKSFPLISEGYVLTYYKILPPTPVWNDNQILLIFSKESIAKSFSLNDTYTDLWRETKDFNELSYKSTQEINRLNDVIRTKDTEIEQALYALNCSNREADELRTKLQASYDVERDLRAQMSANELDFKKKLDSIAKEKEKLLYDIDHYKTARESLADELTNALSTLSRAINESENLARTKTFKLAHLFNRFKLQFLKGSAKDKKDFIHWFKNRSSTTDVHHTYNQIFNIVHILEKVQQDVAKNPDYVANYQFKTSYDQLSENYFSAINSPLTPSAKKMRKILDERSYKGIIVYPHIIHWDNMQTPQHLLRCFAKAGYLCLFAEHDFTNTELKEVEPNLFVLCEKDMIASIFDRQVIVFCTWMCSMGWIEHLKDKVLWYHILDKIDIFSCYDRDYHKKHDEVIQKADIVTYVAHELKRYIPENKKGYYLPNGTNITDFMNIHEGLVPDDMKPLVKSDKKIVGYYGLISHWFDMDMMEQLATRNPDINFVFIGDYVEPAPLPEKDNMFFLGKKPYKELSDYAKFFDCAIIPFEISDMMDCVSPIKFFEYRALGLPVVSSYMKEMEQYESEDVIIAYDTDSFEKGIYKCFEPEIKKTASDTGMNFATQQQWSIRTDLVEKHLNSIYAKDNSKQD